MSTNRNNSKTTTARYKAAILTQKLQENELVPNVPNVQTSTISMIPNDKATVNRRKSTTLAQMHQGNRLVFDVGILWNTTNLAPEIWATVVSTVLNNKNTMFQICLVKLNNVIGNVEISDDFGLWITKHGTTEIQIPIPVQHYYDTTLDDPFPSFSMWSVNIGTMICDHLKNLIEDYMDNNQTVCTCTNMERLLLIIYELEITYMPADADGNIASRVTPLILDWHTDLCQMLKNRAMNRTLAHINQPSRGQISFQPALVYNFSIDALSIRMPINWQVDEILDTNEIASVRFPGVKTNISTTGIPTEMPTIGTNELMLWLLDAEMLLTSMLDPKSTFPPNSRQIALQADSLKWSITDGVYTVADAELIIEAAAELMLVDAYHNRHLEPTWEEEYIPYKEDNSHDTAPQQNDPDLIHHHHKQIQNDCKPAGKPKSDLR